MAIHRQPPAVNRHSSPPRVELLGQAAAGGPELRELALLDQLAEHLYGRALDPDRVFAEDARDDAVVAMAPDPDPLVELDQQLGDLVEVLELAAALVELGQLD